MRSEAEASLGVRCLLTITTLPPFSTQ
jgi:hypothetical protein